MEEEMTSIISNAVMDVIAEASDSNSSSSPFHASKRPRDDSNVSSPKFKGVVLQQNGHWGAQIYANHQRIWLGTFKSETEAAMAYDSAAIKFRSGDSHRNFPWTNLNVQEPSFQNQYSTEAILNMIKDGSYPSKFADFLRTRSQRGETEVGLNLVRVQENEGFLCRQLFQKELTPSDVGKLNRLVIPKKYAIKYFPHISESLEENVVGGAVDDMQLVFYDRLMRSWKFRYCYWRSSQSFVFTRGWNRFVKEKELKTKDIIIFYVIECREGAKKGQTFCMIDVCYNRGDADGGMVGGVNQYVGMQQLELQLDLGENIEYGKDEKEFEDENVLMEVESTHTAEKKECPPKALKLKPANSGSCANEVDD